MAPEPLDDHAVAGLLAREAGDLLLDLRGRSLADGVSGWRLQSLGDRAAHEHLVGRLAELRPDDASVVKDVDRGIGPATRYRAAVPAGAGARVGWTWLRNRSTTTR